MKKAVLAVSVALIAGSAFADVEINKTGYVGAELGGHVLMDNDDDSFLYSNMFKAGGDVTIKVNEDISFIAGGEARAKWEGTEIDDNAYGDTFYDVDRMNVGMITAAGKTTLGKQCGIADDFAGYADLSQEYGLGMADGEIACTEQMINHNLTKDALVVGASYDIEFESYAVGGSYNLEVVELGAVYTKVKSGEGYEEKEAYTLGAVAPIGDLTVAAKYSYADIDSVDTTGYALSSAYSINEAIVVSASYNSEDTKDLDKDDWFTVGASYSVNDYLELVTDYKVSSENDDRLFLRANVNI